MLEVTGACPSKNTKPFFPATLNRFWKVLVAEKEPNWLLNKPLLTKLEALREVKLADPPRAALPARALVRPLMHSIGTELLGKATKPPEETLSDDDAVRFVHASVPLTVPLTARFCREVVPVIVGLLLEAAPIIPGSRGWLTMGYTPFKGLVEPALVPT